MSVLEEVVRTIRTPDPAIAAHTQALLNGKTKPRASLGRLEEVACRIAAIRGSPTPPLPEKAVVVMAADHGVAAEGVSAYPQEVTRQMLSNFASGGAAINVLARHAGARVVVVDMGTIEPPPSAPGILSRRIGPGTRNLAREPAMSRAEALAALDVGIEIARELTGGGVTLLGIGDMGIGNTTSSSALAASWTGAPVEEVTGRGTGVGDEGWGRKVAVVRRALEVNRPHPWDPLDALAKLGGFEIAGLAGVVLGAAACRVPVVLDGFITGVAALAAVRLAPAAADALLASHRSVEPGHRIVLEALGLRPLLDLELRLGEGTGAALAMGLVDAALRILCEMATFDSAGVSDSGA
ncbi:MAG: nicotinate-nucleotide--dimethylbenzimidazole phosphoribosyltransferase [Planctomycetales bacterium]|nr:nicotinate-nucleotide--dimethylbenzimidazole phosphoribosyltransferase [Planctomycetales bacterium]